MADKISHLVLKENGYRIYPHFTEHDKECMHRVLQRQQEHFSFITRKSTARQDKNGFGVRVKTMPYEFFIRRVR